MPKIPNDLRLTPMDVLNVLRDKHLKLLILPALFCLIIFSINYSKPRVWQLNLLIKTAKISSITSDKLFEEVISSKQLKLEYAHPAILAKYLKNYPNLKKLQDSGQLSLKLDINHSLDVDLVLTTTLLEPSYKVLHDIRNDLVNYINEAFNKKVQSLRNELAKVESQLGHYINQRKLVYQKVEEIPTRNIGLNEVLSITFINRELDSMISDLIQKKMILDNQLNSSYTQQSYSDFEVSKSEVLDRPPLTVKLILAFILGFSLSFGYYLLKMCASIEKENLS